MSPEEFGLPPDAFGPVDDGVSAGAMSLLPQGYRRPVVTPAPRPQPQVQRTTTALEAIDNKLKLATYYRAVLDEPIFDDPNDPFAAQVQAELSEFVTGRMAELVGAGKPKPVEALTEAEVKVLKFIAQNLSGTEVQAVKYLAQKLLGGPAAPQARVSAPPPAATPEPEPVAPPKPPRIRGRKAPVAPEVQKVEAPTTAARRSIRKVTNPALGRNPLDADQPEAPSPAPSPRKPHIDAQSPHRVPMPTGAAMTAVTQQKAYESLADPHIKEPGTP